MVHTTSHEGGHAAPISRAQTGKWSFLGVFVLIFFMSYSVLAGLGLTPEPAKVVKEAPRLTATALNALPVGLPTKISIPALDREVTIANPTSTKVETLDAALLHGAVRYPTSAKLGEEGNVVLFGHSSYLPVVHNEAYKAFNGVQELEKGDRITVESAGQAYVYAVDNVYQADASEDAIPLTSTGRTLTLVTCDSFASKQDRFIVVATLVESYSIAN